MRSPEFGFLNPERPNLEIIKDLKEKRFIKDGSPFWWSIDYAPDPREYLPFEEFRRRLVCLGECNTRRGLHGWREDVIKRDVYLYPEPQVPVTILKLPIEGQKLPFLVTARPYHKKELYFHPFPKFLYEHPLETLPEYARSGGVIELTDHFYPHIRGLSAGRRGNHFFWYPLRVNSFWHDFGQKIQESLERHGLSFIGVYESPTMAPTEERTYSEVWGELIKKERLVDFRKPSWIDFEATEVSAEEFLEDYQKTDQDLMVFYPLRLPDIESTLPLIVATRTHQESRLKEPVVLGIYAENGRMGRCRRGGILRIKDRQLAEAVSESISEDFRIPVDTVLFTPQKGRPKYERVSGSSS